MTKTPEVTEKKEVQGKTEHAPKAETHKGKGYTPLPGGCQYRNCKTPAARFGFCPEHYEQFKFGLIKKNGEHVSDYEKKFDHYTAYKQKQVAKKVA